MTTIIAKKNPNGTVDLGADSQSTAGNVIRHSKKIAHINGQFYLGGGGSGRFCDIIEYADVPHIHESDLESKKFDAKGWLVTQAVPSWINSLKNAEQEHLDKEDWPNGVLLVVLAGRIFQVFGDFTVDECLDFGGIGSGSGYAVGALAAGKSIEEALEIAADLDPYTGGELHVLKGLR